jgi:hypothetical protein
VSQRSEDESQSPKKGLIVIQWYDRADEPGQKPDYGCSLEVRPSVPGAEVAAILRTAADGYFGKE